MKRDGWVMVHHPDMGLLVEAVIPGQDDHVAAQDKDGSRGLTRVKT